MEEIEKLLEICNLPKPNQEEIENLDRLIVTNHIESVIKKLPTHKYPETDGVTGEL